MIKNKVNKAINTKSKWYISPKKRKHESLQQDCSPLSWNDGDGCIHSHEEDDGVMMESQADYRWTLAGATNNMFGSGSSSSPDATRRGHWESTTHGGRCDGTERSRPYLEAHFRRRVTTGSL